MLYAILRRYAHLGQRAQQHGESGDADKRTDVEAFLSFGGQFQLFLVGRYEAAVLPQVCGRRNVFRLYKTSGLVNEEVARLAEQCLSATSIGTDALTDYLALTLYAGNFNHRPASAAPMELQDTYVRLDQALAKILAAVEQKVGLDNTLFVLTSTGTEDEENEDLNKYKIPGGTFDVKRSVSLLNMYLSAVYGQGQYIESCLGTQLLLGSKIIGAPTAEFE